MTTLRPRDPDGPSSVFLVERYLPAAAAGNLAPSVARAARLCALSAESGPASMVQYLHSAYLPAEDTRTSSPCNSPRPPRGTLVIGIPFAFPPGPPTLPGYARTSITTAGGVVNIDTFLAPPGAVNRFALPGLAIVSIHPPGPCRVRTSGTAVVFTPVIPPGPPS
jgi:hypothetical protein